MIIELSIYVTFYKKANKEVIPILNPVVIGGDYIGLIKTLLVR